MQPICTIFMNCVHLDIILLKSCDNVCQADTMNGTWKSKWRAPNPVVCWYLHSWSVFCNIMLTVSFIWPFRNVGFHSEVTLASVFKNLQLQLVRGVLRPCWTSSKGVFFFPNALKSYELSLTHQSECLFFFRAGTQWFCLLGIYKS